MLTQWLALALTVVGATVAAQTVPAQTAAAQTVASGKVPAAAPKPAAAAKPEDAVRQAGQTYIAALNAGNFAAAAALWTADGELVNPSGRAMKARKVVAEDLAKRFPAGKRPVLSLKVGSVRMATPDTAIEEGTVDVKTPDGQAVPRAQYTAVWVKQQNKWLLHNLRETAPAPSHRQSLAELAWMLGDWTGADDGRNVRVHCEWAPGKSFLLRQIRVEQQGKLQHEISQRIGLDPFSPRIKSWSFDADGGLAEAFWDKVGDDWHVFSRGATNTGQMTSAKNVYSKISPDGFTLSSLEAHVGHEAQPKFSVEFTRADDGAEPPADTATADPAPATPAGAARERILNSREWRETQRAFQEWLSVQKIYTPAEVKQMRAGLRARIDQMSAEQLQDFLADSRQKLAILMGKEADEARLWIAQRMAVEVNLTPEQIKKMRPDVAQMTSAQVEQWLTQWQEQRQQTRNTQQAFERGRNQQVKAIEQATREAEREREAALNRAYESMSSPYGYYYGGGGPVNNPGRAASYGWGYRY